MPGQILSDKKEVIYMLLSIALILLVGMATGWICKKCKLPSLLGMLATGILLGPYVLDLIDASILAISSDIRKIALIIILTRAGLSLDISGLKKIGRPAVMMCFVPATFELIGMICIAPKLLGLSLLEVAILGSVLAAVSPAVVVPRMVKLMEEGYIGGGMLPKIQNCIDAIENGVSRVHILDGRIPHCLLLEIFTNKGIGTAIKNDVEERYYHGE